jgi:hypothetical protein
MLDAEQPSPAVDPEVVPAVAAEVADTGNNLPTASCPIFGRRHPSYGSPRLSAGLQLMASRVSLPAFAWW